MKDDDRDDDNDDCWERKSSPSIGNPFIRI